MFLSSRHELYVLLASLFGGIMTGFVFDFFRIIRKNFDFAKKLVWLQDVLMWSAILSITYATVFITNNGRVRWYILLGFGTGTVLYLTLLSRQVTKFFSFLITIAKRCTYFLLNLLSGILNLLIRPVHLVVNLLKAIIINPAERLHGKITKIHIFFKKK